MDTILQVDSFFAEKREAWFLFDALSKAVMDRWPHTQLRVMKTCIALDDPKPYCYVSFPKKKAMQGLMVSISLKERMEHPRFFMVVPISKCRHTVHMHIEEKQEIDEEMLDLIALSRR